MRADSETDRNFVLQQGLHASSIEGCAVRTSALLFQPRVIGVIVLAGVVTQSAGVFAALGAMLAWCAILPRLNPFEAVYNNTLGRRAGAPRLEAAPPPRRFSQSLAAAMSIGIAIALAWDVRPLAWAIEAMLALAVAALTFGRFCLGSFVYHLLRGRARFALDTLPWSRGAGEGRM